jgi:serpin B
VWLFVVLKLTEEQVSAQQQRRGVNGEKQTNVQSKPIFPTNEIVSDFSWELFQQVQQSSPNIVISPFSIQLLLGYISTAAEFPTRDQITGAIRFLHPKPLDSLKNKILQKSSKREFQFANFLMYANYLSLNSTFVQQCELWNVERLRADFSKPQSVNKEFQRYVAQKSKGKLKPQLENISPETRIILSNVIYFNSQWAYEFEPVGLGDFYISSDRRSVVNYMKINKKKLRYGQVKGGYQWVELPYDTGSDTMVLVIPDGNINEMLKQFSSEHLKDIINRTSSNSFHEVTLIMPKFSIDSSLSLVEPLQALGVRDLFSLRANIPYLADNSRIVINDVQQQTVIEVDEKGTVAAAVSSFIGVGLSYTPELKEIEVVVDRPFLAIVMDKENRIPLFISKVVQPTPANVKRN